MIRVARGIISAAPMSFVKLDCHRADASQVEEQAEIGVIVDECHTESTRQEA